MVDVNGSLERSCATVVSEGLRVNTETSTAQAVRVEGMQRILGNHELYCTICDYNNGDCTVHNATALLQIEHQKYEFEPKPYELDDSNPFYQYDPDQCILCGRCVQACQNVQVTETLSIDWDAEHPRVLWDGGSAIDDSSCVSCGHCITVCPCNALMEKSMVGEAGHFTGKDVPQSVRRPAIELVKSFEPYTGYSPIFALSDAEAAMREADIKKTKTVCTYCGVGCSFDIWTKGRQILKVDPQFEAPANSISTCIKGKFGWDYTNSDERITTPLIRDGDRFREASWDEALDLIAEKLGEHQGAARTAQHRRHRLVEVHQRRVLPHAEVRAGDYRHQQRGQLLALLPVARDGGAVAHGGLRRRRGLDQRHREGATHPHRRLEHRRVAPRLGDPHQEFAEAARAKGHRFGFAQAHYGGAGGHLLTAEARHGPCVALGGDEVHSGQRYGPQSVLGRVGQRR